MKRTPRAAVDYGPTPTVLASGDVDRDAVYVLALAGKPQRQHELWRLGHIHGLDHQREVEKRVLAIWRTKNAGENQKAA